MAARILILLFVALCFFAILYSRSEKTTQHEKTKDEITLAKIGDARKQTQSASKTMDSAVEGLRQSSADLVKKRNETAPFLIAPLTANSCFVRVKSTLADGTTTEEFNEILGADLSRLTIAGKGELIKMGTELFWKQKGKSWQKGADHPWAKKLFQNKLQSHSAELAEPLQKPAGIVIQPRKISYLPDETINSVPMSVVEYGASSEECRIWISKQDGLLRKMECKWSPARDFSASLTPKEKAKIVMKTVGEFSYNKKIRIKRPI